MIVEQCIPMKLLLSIAVTAIMHSSIAYAAVEQCRFIEKKLEREVCYHRQADALTGKSRASAAKKATTDPIQQMKLEDEALSRRLRSICRGC